MSDWIMMMLASGAVLALFLLFTLLVVALDNETEEETQHRRDETRWTSAI